MGKVGTHHMELEKYVGKQWPQGRNVAQQPGMRVTVGQNTWKMVAAWTKRGKTVKTGGNGLT